MKIFKKFSLFFILILIFAISCGTMNKSVIQTSKNVALISVYCDKQIKAPEFKGLATALNQLSHSEDFDLTGIVNRLRDDFYSKYADVFQLSVLPEADVINNISYKTNSKEKNFKLTFNQDLIKTPEGYYGISSSYEKGKINKILSSLNVDLGAIMHAEYTLSKSGIQIFGFGKAKVDSTLYLELVDKNGKTVFYKTASATSKKSMKFALGGLFKTSELLPLCDESTTLAEAKMDEWIKKQFAKK